MKIQFGKKLQSYTGYFYKTYGFWPIQSKTHNLLKRMRNREDDILRFMTEPPAEFTNNQAEKDLRMNKVRATVSGGFRELGARTGIHAYPLPRRHRDKTSRLSIANAGKRVYPR